METLSLSLVLQRTQELKGYCVKGKGTVRDKKIKKLTWTLQEMKWGHDSF